MGDEKPNSRFAPPSRCWRAAFAREFTAVHERDHGKYRSLVTISRYLLAIVMVANLAACGSSGGEPAGPTLAGPARIEAMAGSGQSAVAGTALPTSPTVEVVDSAGRPLSGVTVSFNVVEGDGWVVADRSVTGASGRASATWYVGPGAGDAQSLEAKVGSLSVRFAAVAQRPTVGAQILGANSYIEWIPGDLPIVISAPHGGTMLPSEIPDRTSGTLTRDLNTEELARDVVNAFVARFGRRPHLIICRLSRRKLDANREIVEAAAANPFAERAWREYHGFIEASAAEVRRTPGLGFYVDLHGHGHDIQRLELGYLLGGSVLALSDAQLPLSVAVPTSSLWPVAVHSGTPFPALLRGSVSLGAYLEAAGFPSVPSPAAPSPGSAPYFDGGYSTQRHGTSTDNRFAGVQIESNMNGVRDTPANRAAFASALVSSLELFLGTVRTPARTPSLVR